MRLACLIAAMLISVPAVAQVSVTERTRTYLIDGRNAAEFAASMTKRGPYSRQHRQRVWATASRTMRYRVTGRRDGKSCRPGAVSVRMTIEYELPRLRDERRVSRAERTRWRRMLKLLTDHERTHGRFYRELAAKTHRTLTRLPGQRDCRRLERLADATVKKMSARNQKRNDDFDRGDRNRYRRMEQIYALRLR